MKRLSTQTRITIIAVMLIAHAVLYSCGGTQPTNISVSTPIPSRPQTSTDGEVETTWYDHQWYRLIDNKYGIVCYAQGDTTTVCFKIADLRGDQ